MKIVIEKNLTKEQNRQARVKPQIGRNSELNLNQCRCRYHLGGTKVS